MATTSKKTSRTTPHPSKTATGKPAVRKPNRSNLVPAPPFQSKTEHVIGMLRRKDGASLTEIMDALGWKEPSVRALLTATIAKGRGLPLAKSQSPGEPTRYYIAAIRSAKKG